MLCAQSGTVANPEVTPATDRMPIAARPHHAHGAPTAATRKTTLDAATTGFRLLRGIYLEPEPEVLPAPDVPEPLEEPDVPEDPIPAPDELELPGDPLAPEV